MPFGAVVEPLLLLVVEPRVARVAGNRRHPLSALSPLRSLRILLAPAGTGGEGSSFSPSPSGPASPCTRRRLGGEELGESGGGAGKRGRRRSRRGRGVAAFGADVGAWVSQASGLHRLS